VVTVLLGPACRKEAAEPAAPSAAEQGKALYERGLGATGLPIVAMLGGGTLQVPATQLPCVNCHGPDGRGRPEGGVTPSNLRWDSLTRPYEVVEGSGRHHPPYDTRLLARAISLGIDPAGNALDDAMPRYELSHADLENLIAYLRTLGKAGDPGVSEMEVRVGTVVVLGPAAGAGRAARAALEAYFEELNRKGGIFGRRLSLRAIEAPASQEGRREALSKLLDTERPFALTNVMVDRAGEGLARLLEAQQIPVVGAHSPYPTGGTPPERYLFYLYSGLVEQARALAVHAATLPLSNRRVIILHRPGEETRGVAQVSASCAQAGLGPVEAHVLEEGKTEALMAALARSRPGVAILLGSSSSVRELREGAARAGWRPLFLVPGALLGKESATGERGGRLILALPSSPVDQSPQTLAEYRQLATTYGLPAEHVPAQLSALAGAKLLVEGLKRAGRELTREALVRSLEGLYEFQTGLTPPLSYGKTRRIGALGAYLFELDAARGQLSPVTGWTAVSQGP
jgi:ABC-type branched-subunit amino acid transport system substrate-binding protein